MSKVERYIKSYNDIQIDILTYLSAVINEHENQWYAYITRKVFIGYMNKYPQYGNNIINYVISIGDMRMVEFIKHTTILFI
jgi:hypothetical protein